MIKVFKGDKSIYAVLVLLSLISLFGVQTTYGSSVGVWQHLLKQIMFLVMGLLVFIFFENVNYRSLGFKYFVIIGYLFSVVAVILLPIIGVKGGGAARTINLGLFSFQPIEIAKIFAVISTAFLCSKHINKINESFKGLAIYLLLPLLLIIGPILPQNLSSVIIIAFPILIMLLMSNINKKYIFILLGVGVLAFLLYIILEGNRSSTWQSRISVFFGEKVITARDPRTAVGHGGLLGTFPGDGKVKLILDNVESDYIYSILIEEGGMIFGLFIMLLYLVFLLRVIRIALMSEDLLGKLLVAGIGLLISFQAYIHMMVAVGVIPVTGQQLPFVSKGGSSLLVLCMAVGIVQNVCIRNNMIRLQKNSELQYAD
jgi:cell division protein FtsW